MYRYRLLVCWLLAGASPLPAAAFPLLPFVSEIHYENAGVDRGEFVEIGAAGGTDLAGWTLSFYNGANGAQYGSMALGGTVPDLTGAIGFVTVFPSFAIQNGAPDGLALLSPVGVVQEFLSYEGQFDATGGVLAGLRSVQIPVSESASSPVDFSLQRIGSLDDWDWLLARATPGRLNDGLVVSRALSLSAPAQLLAPLLVLLLSGRLRRAGRPQYAG